MEAVMEITDVRIRKLMTAQQSQQAGRLKGIVSITFDGIIAVHDIKIVQGDRRLFVAMPSRKDDSGVYRDIVHPITSDARSLIEQTVLSAYREEMERQQAEEGQN